MSGPKNPLLVQIYAADTAMLSMLLLLVPSCSDEMSDNSDLGEDTTQEYAKSLPDAAASKREALSRPFSHPLAQVKRVGNLVPFADVHTSPEGRRYVMEEGTDINSYGEVVNVSGVFEYDVRKLTSEEMDEMRRKKDVAPISSPTPVMGASLLKFVNSSPPEDDSVVVLMRVKEPEGPGLEMQIQALIARGMIKSQVDLETWERRLTLERQVVVASAQAPVVEAIEAMGGEVIARHKNLFGLDAKLSVSMIARLSNHKGVVRMGLDSQGVRLADIDGSLIVRGTQIAQFIDNGYDGEYGVSDIHTAVIDLDPYNDEHPGFKDASAGSRIAGRYVCGASCASTTFPVPSNPHATAVAGLVFGDLRDGQDSTYPGSNTAAQIARSGYAGEAHGYLYQLNPGLASSARKAFDHIIGLVPKPHIITMSVGFPEDAVCFGDTSLSMDANDLYENGQLLITAAGNTGHASSTDCTVLSPSSAIGVFAVGGHGNSATGVENDVRSAAVYANSALGGTSPTEGKSRTIIDVTAYAYRKSMFDAVGGYAYNDGGTSFAAPTVAGGAVDYSDFYKTYNSGSTTIDSPGIMAASLLLMGDRDSKVGKLNFGFDNLWGAGRLKMRKGDLGGLDFPGIWKNNSACVEEGEVVTIPVNSGATLSSAADDFKAVIYWYDRRHEFGTAIDDIDLYLRKTDLTDLQTSTSSSDEKERVYYSSVGGKAVQLDIVGYRITADNEGCGVNSMMVHWAYFYEDDSRDDADGPLSVVIETE